MSDLQELLTQALGNAQYGPDVQQGIQSGLANAYEGVKTRPAPYGPEEFWRRANAGEAQDPAYWDQALNIMGMANWGGKRHLRAIKHGGLYHGTKDPGDFQSVLENGFNRGRSAELGIKGTSVSTDPKVSLQFAGDYMPQVFQVDPWANQNLTPEQKAMKIYNIRPSEYLAGDYSNFINEPGAAGSKPHSYNYFENEIFFPKANGAQAALGPYQMPTDKIQQLNDFIESNQGGKTFFKAPYIWDSFLRMRKGNPSDTGVRLNDFINAVKNMANDPFTQVYMPEHAGFAERLRPLLDDLEARYYDMTGGASGVKHPSLNFTASKTDLRNAYDSHYRNANHLEDQITQIVDREAPRIVKATPYGQGYAEHLADTGRTVGWTFKASTAPAQRLQILQQAKSEGVPLGRLRDYIVAKEFGTPYNSGIAELSGGKSTTYNQHVLNQVKQKSGMFDAEKELGFKPDEDWHNSFNTDKSHQAFADHFPAHPHAVDQAWYAHHTVPGFYYNPKTGTYNLPGEFNPVGFQNPKVQELLATGKDEFSSIASPPAGLPAAFDWGTPHGGLTGLDAIDYVKKQMQSMPDYANNFSISKVHPWTDPKDPGAKSWQVHTNHGMWDVWQQPDGSIYGEW